MSANPIGLIILGITALIAAIILLIIYYKQVINFTQKWWDKLKGILFIISPLTAGLIIIIEIIRSIAKRWDKIASKFKEGDVAGAFKEIGKAILDGVLSPLEAVLKLIGKIPFMKGVSEKALEGIEALKTKLGINIGEDKGIKTGISKKTTQNVNVKTDVSVYTEKNMKVEPFMKRNDYLGYQMRKKYAK